MVRRGGLPRTIFEDHELRRGDCAVVCNQVGVPTSSLGDHSLMKWRMTVFYGINKKIESNPIVYFIY